MELTPTAKATKRKNSRGFLQKARNFFFSGPPLVLFVLVVVFGVLYYFRGQFIVATVNGSPITRLALLKELENNYGQQALSNLVTKKIVYQQAAKNNVSVTDAEVAEGINEIETAMKNQGQNLDDVLGAQGLDRNLLEEQIRYQKLLEKMAAGDVTVTDEDVNQYLKENKELFPEETSTEDLRSRVKEQLLQQKRSQKINDWFSEVRDAANIKYLLSL